MSIIIGLFLTVLGLILLIIAGIHYGFRAPRLPNLQTPEHFGIAYRPVNFEGKQSCKLAAWWLPTSEPCQTTVVILHGWGANKAMMLPLAKPFYQQGLNVFLFDAHNHGDSDKRGVSTMPKFAEDLHCAVDWLKVHHSQSSQSIIVVGHSVGAAATLLAASKQLPVQAVISIASFAHPKRMMRRHLHKLNAIPGLVWLISEYVQWVIGHRFDAIAPINTIQKINQPTLCLHGDQDQVIPLQDHLDTCAATNAKWVQCQQIPGADHDSIELIDQHFDIIQTFLNTIESTQAYR